MTRRHPIVRGLVILTAITLGLALLAVGLVLVVGGEAGDRLAFGRAVAVLEIRGVIEEATDVVGALERFRKRDATVAVVLRLDSPGGAVPPAQEIYDAVWRVRGQKPVVASLGNVAASAAYYVAAAANTIVSAPGTLTGSMGVIMQLPYYGPLAEKVGVSEQVVKSGEFKDIGDPLRMLLPEERALLQGMIDDVLGQFVDAVARGRGMEPAQVRALADGRVMTGAQARAAGLVDRLGGLDDAIRLAWEQAGQTGEPRVTRVRARRPPWWVRLLAETLLAEPRGPAGGGFVSVYRGPLAR
jgi:protease-4